jgi:DNA polymerase V
LKEKRAIFIEKTHHLSSKLDLNKYLVNSPAATYFLRAATADRMTQYGIYDNDLLLVDRSLNPENSNIVIIAIDGKLSVSLFKIKGNKKIFFKDQKETSFYQLDSDSESDGYVWGVVTHVIHSL